MGNMIRSRTSFLTTDGLTYVNNSTTNDQNLHFETNKNNPPSLPRG